MKYNTIASFSTKDVNKSVLVFLLLLIHILVSAQQTTVLPGNNNYSQTSSPNGGLRYQRGFYLITADEMKASGLANSNALQSIGFTLGAAQKDTTKGAFKVYLQNTTDAVSRVDTSWTNITTSTTSLVIPSGLFSGSYEWQVRSICGSNSPYSNLTTFSNDNLGACGLPTNPTTTNITTTTATFNWEAPASTVTKYYLEFKSSDAAIWTLDSTTISSYTANNLLPNKNYQWRVRTACSASTSDFITTQFLTNSTVSCNAPGSLTVGAVADSSAQVSWTAASGASYYTVQYRRVGTLSWGNATAFTNSYNLKSVLVPGTTYEWQVRTNCAAGTGAFVSGANFTTTGTATCYPPINLTTNAITDTSAVFKWTAVAGASSYELRYRLKETISWNKVIAGTTPMTLVHQDSLVIPATAGPYDIPFKNGNAFTYTGNAVYVAWEYSQSTGALSSANNTTISTTANTSLKSVNGIDSIKYLLSFVAKSDSSTHQLQSRLVSTNLRPETRLGSSALRDSSAVVAVYALGSTAPSFITASISALVRNSTNSARNIQVTLTVKESKTNAVRYSNTQTVSVASKSNKLVSFTGWTPVSQEKDSIIVTVPADANENVINNNRNFYVQNVVNSFVAYDDGTDAVTQAGFDTSAGLLLTKYHIDNCGKINSARVYLSASAKGHALYAVALDSSGSKIAQSATFTPDSTQVNGYHTFYFPSGRLLKAEDYYVGLAQPSKGYLPVGVQWEGGSTRTNAYYRAGLDGTGLISLTEPGRLMIAAELVSGIAMPEITGRFSLCGSTPQTLTAGSTKTRFADSIINFSSQSSTIQYGSIQALGTPDIYPEYGANPNGWVSATGDGGREYITLRFPNAAKANFIDIFETLNPGSVDTVYIKNPATSAYEIVYSATAAPAPKGARVNRISFPLTAFDVSEVRIALNSAAVPGFNAIDAVGVGEMITPATFSTYLWAPGGETTQTKSVSTAGTYKLTVTDANGCQASDTAVVTSPVQVVPTITATRPTTFCNGDSTILKSSQKGGNTWSTGATTDSIIVKTAGSYSVVYDDGSGCGTTTSTATTVTLNASPVVSITGASAICPGGSTTFDAGSGFSSYLWSTGATTQSINVNRQGTYTVKVTNANGCSATGSVNTTVAPNLTPAISGSLSFCSTGSTVLDAGSGYTSYVWSTGATTRTITVNTAGSFSVSVTNTGGCSGSSGVTTSFYPTPTPSITGNLTFCPGSNTTLDAGAGFSSYLWSTGATTQTISVTTAGNYSVTVTNANGCSGTANVTTSLYTAPSPAISGNAGFCPGSTTTVTANAGFNTYLWSTGNTSPSLIVNTAGTYTVNVIDNNGCTGAKSIVVSQYTPPAPVISGTLSFCGGNATTLDAGSGYSAYTWSNQMTTQSITVTTVNTFSVTVTDSRGCTGSTSVTTTKQSSLPQTPGPITGPVTGLCGTTGNVYSISPVPNASSYVWSVPSGAVITSGQGSTSITVSYNGSFASGNIVVAASNACGQSSSVNPQTLPVQSALASPTQISGQLTGLCGKTSQQYTINAVPNATSYTWTTPTGVTISNGQGTTAVTVTFGSTFTSGNICVKANNGCGSGPSTCTTISKIPSITTSITGPANICSKQQGVTYSIPAVTGATSYTWTLPSQANIVSGDGTNSITVNFGTKGGNITVRANNTCGSSNTQSIAVAVNCQANNKQNLRVVEQVSLDRKLTMYPNPTSGIVNVKLQNFIAGAYLVNVYEATGKMVQSRTITLSGNALTIDLQHLSKGAYFVHLIGSGTRDIVRVIVR